MLHGYIYIMPAVEGEFNLVWEDKPLNKEFSLAEKIKKQSYDTLFCQKIINWKNGIDMKFLTLYIHRLIVILLISTIKSNYDTLEFLQWYHYFWFVILLIKII